MRRIFWNDSSEQMPLSSRSCLRHPKGLVASAVDKLWRSELQTYQTLDFGSLAALEKVPTRWFSSAYSKYLCYLEENDLVPVPANLKLSWRVTKGSAAGKAFFLFAHGRFINGGAVVRTSRCDQRDSPMCYLPLRCIFCGGTIPSGDGDEFKFMAK